MSSSTFEVIETENESEKELSFGLEACEENGIESQDGDIQKDHTYTKDPDDSSEEFPEDSEQITNKKGNESPVKNATRNSKVKALKKTNNRNAKSKKEPPTKKESSPKKAQTRTKKEVLTEDSNKSDENLETEKSEEKNATEEPSKSSRRVSRKRKVEEKENVIDRSIAEEVQNINEREPVKGTNSESPAKSKDVTDKPKPKKAKKASLVPGDKEDNENLPKGWVRKIVVRKSGKTAGQVDVYIYSPDGIKFRSRPDIAAYLAKTKSNLKLEDFNFSKKATSGDSTLKLTPKKEKPASTTKSKSTTEKKRAKEPATPKKSTKLLVKIQISPKKGKGKKVANKTARKVKSPGKNKAVSSGSKASKKKKNA